MLGAPGPILSTLKTGHAKGYRFKDNAVVPYEPVVSLSLIYVTCLKMLNTKSQRQTVHKLEICTLFRVASVEFGAFLLFPAYGGNYCFV